MTHKITTKRAHTIRRAVRLGLVMARYPWYYSTLDVMQRTRDAGFTRFQRKVAVDVYHRNR